MAAKAPRRRAARGTGARAAAAVLLYCVLGMGEVFAAVSTDRVKSQLDAKQVQIMSIKAAVADRAAAARRAAPMPPVRVRAAYARTPACPPPRAAPPLTAERRSSRPSTSTSTPRSGRCPTAFRSRAVRRAW